MSDNWQRPIHMTGRELIEHLEPHYTDRTAKYYHYEDGKRVDVVRRLRMCRGWQSHPDIERIDPDALYRWARGGTCPSWQKVNKINTPDRAS